MSNRARPRWRRALGRGAVALGLLVALALAWVGVEVEEMRTGRRLWPWSAYALCGGSRPAELPAHVRVGLYEEFPNPWRLAKLRQLDFPVSLAVAARSREEFLGLSEQIARDHPQVREVFYWPLLSEEEGYYPGPWSSPEGVARAAASAEGLPLLWDMELPRGLRGFSVAALWQNRATLASLFAGRKEPAHIWRSHTSMGLDPAFLRLTAMHFDPLDYPSVSLHLDLYTTGAGQDEGELRRIMRCGVERYGARFIPSLGVLNDHEGPESIFIPPETLRRNLRVAREAGVSEVWIFGANGLDDEYLRVIRETLPLEPLPTR